MGKEEMAAMLEKQVGGLTDFVNGYKACAKFIMDNWDKKEDGTGIKTNPGNTEGA